MDRFPNGFTSWAETHFEVVQFITSNADDGGVIGFTHIMGGIGAVYELAETWTDEFEQKNQTRDWDGDFFDEIERFCTEKNNVNYKP